MPVSEVIKGLKIAGDKAAASPSSARDFLIRAGIVDSTGSLTKYYQ